MAASCVIVIGFARASEPPLSTITFRVLDEGGHPVADASVHGTGYWRPAKSKGVTDADGYFSYEDRVYGDVGCRVSKAGYYDTHGEVWPGPRRFGDHPTNTFAIVLKRIINPVPMLARHLVVLNVPKTNEVFALDLERGDWVGPAGKGIVTDVWVTAEKRFASREDRDLTVTLAFAGGDNGIQEFWAPESCGMSLTSDLMPPQEAPDAGYRKSTAVFGRWRPGVPQENSWTKDRNYVYRVRARTNEVGRVVEANVGWIRRDISIWMSEEGRVGFEFSYYFNPDCHSRSLEPKEPE